MPLPRASGSAAAGSRRTSERRRCHFRGRVAHGARGARPDRTFGSGRGWVTTRIPGAAAVAYAAAVMRGEKIVIAGRATTPGWFDASEPAATWRSRS